MTFEIEQAGDASSGYYRVPAGVFIAVDQSALVRDKDGDRCVVTNDERARGSMWRIDERNHIDEPDYEWGWVLMTDPEVVDESEVPR